MHVEEIEKKFGMVSIFIPGERELLAGFYSGVVKLIDTVPDSSVPIGHRQRFL